MRGVYRAPIKISGLAAAKTLIYITAPANKVIEILSAQIGSSGANVTNQQLEAVFQKVNSLGTPTGTAITPTKAEQGDQASAATVVGNVTASEPTYTSNTEADKKGFSSLGGYQHAPVPEERLYIAGGDTWGLRMLSTPTSLDVDVEIVYREIG